MVKLGQREGRVEQGNAFMADVQYYHLKSKGQ